MDTLISNASSLKMVTWIRMSWYRLHQLSPSWDTLTMVRQPFWIPFVTPMVWLRQVKLVGSPVIGAYQISWNGKDTFLIQRTRPLLYAGAWYLLPIYHLGRSSRWRVMPQQSKPSTTQKPPMFQSLGHQWLINQALTRAWSANYWTLPDDVNCLGWRLWVCRNSAKFNQNIDELLETVLCGRNPRIKADPNCSKAIGTGYRSAFDKGKVRWQPSCSTRYLECPFQSLSEIPGRVSPAMTNDLTSWR